MVALFGFFTSPSASSPNSFVNPSDSYAVDRKCSFIRNMPHCHLIRSVGGWVDMKTHGWAWDFNPGAYPDSPPHGVPATPMWRSCLTPSFQAKERLRTTQCKRGSAQV